MSDEALDDAGCRGRALAAALEPFVGSVYFAPGVHAGYAGLTAGFDGAGVQVLIERVAGMPPRSYARTRGWSGAELAGAEAWLVDRGLVDATGGATVAGRAAREELERRTDTLSTTPAA